MDPMGNGFGFCFNVPGCPTDSWPFYVFRQVFPSLTRYGIMGWSDDTNRWLNLTLMTMVAICCDPHPVSSCNKTKTVQYQTNHIVSNSGIASMSSPFQTHVKLWFSYVKKYVPQLPIQVSGWRISEKHPDSAGDILIPQGMSIPWMDLSSRWEIWGPMFKWRLGNTRLKSTKAWGVP